jgi:RHS repeat-associated protein
VRRDRARRRRSGSATPASTATPGLVNLRARSYDPVLGRFIGRDTFGGVLSAPQTGNRYSYATSNPLRFSDPSGHFVQAVIDHPWTVVEIIVSFNPVGALVISSYILITGTDPATGERVDPQWGLLGIATVILPPIVAKAIIKVLGGMVRGIGNVVTRAAGLGATVARDVGAGARALGTVAREGVVVGTAAREGAAAAGTIARDARVVIGGATERSALRIYAAEGRLLSAERAGSLNPGATGKLYATDAKYEFGNVAQSNLAIDARGEHVVGYWDVPAEYPFKYDRRVPFTEKWDGGGREFTWPGSIPYDKLGPFRRIPWAAGQ